MKEKAEFNKGQSAAMDPVNKTVNQDGHAITSLFSPWLHSHCPICKHSFRLGDEVFVTSNDNVVHDGDELACRNNDSVIKHHSEESIAFFQGLDATWPPPKGLPVVRLEKEHYLLEPPLASFKRHTCAVCCHTFRPGDIVIICPCSPDKPKCGIAVHRDSLHNLDCWGLWGSDDQNKLQYCLATSRKLL